jgi:protein TonB
MGSSPVQPGKSRPWLVFGGAGIAALIAWTLQQPSMQSEADQRSQRPDPTVSERSSLAHRAKANLPSYFSTDDYPLEALRRNQQGTTAFILSIDRRGRVERCTIATSSGSPSLDEATCSILKRRARFDPARDDDGRRVADTTSGRIKWVLPED